MSFLYLKIKYAILYKSCALNSFLTKKMIHEFVQYIKNLFYHIRELLAVSRFLL